MKTETWQAVVSFLFLFLFTGLGPAGAQAPDQAIESLPGMISSAKTAADHEKIATYYDAAAKEARQRAEDHEQMGQAYKSLGGALVHKLKLDEHCSRLTKSGRTDAEDYEGLAKAHRAMAQSAP
ncbi:MAG: hypothetical protein AB1689_12905 [Thermodesulfobacteriota bacterium]